jgi:hypothetical protein
MVAQVAMGNARYKAENETWHTFWMLVVKKVAYVKKNIQDVWFYGSCD